MLAVLPFCALIIWASWGYVAVSFRLGEGPMALGGLPFTPWLKSLMLVMAGLLGVQATAIAIRAAGVLTGATDSVFPRRPVVAEPV
jgi:TRAP-type mannitol/chloroaromatic compound transport system permease small subunit